MEWGCVGLVDWKLDAWGSYRMRTSRGNVGERAVSRRRGHDFDVYKAAFDMGDIQIVDDGILVKLRIRNVADRRGGSRNQVGPNA